MKLEFKFENIAELKKVYDPVIVQKAAHETIKQLHSKAATAISEAVRLRYRINARDVKSALKPRVRVDQDGIPTGYLIYLGPRISLRRFSSKARPKIKTTQTRERKGVAKSYRVTRLGARVRVVNTRPSHIVKGGFFGTGRAGLVDGAGAEQIFKRIGPWVKGDKNPIKKLTGPSIAHMVRGQASIKALNDLMQREGDEKFANNLEHFMQKQMGLR